MAAERKILIIDDETDLCLLLKDYFTRKQYDVSLSHTLAEGEVLLASVKPDILFLDNNLPDGNGWQLAPALASKFPAVYIILISAFHPDVPEMPFIDNFRIIEKPISLHDLDKQFSTF
ncbi:MAG: response regulator [Taibaiella sp.]|nr:response regulator [Taibaiella sp.]